MPSIVVVCAVLMAYTPVYIGVISMKINQAKACKIEAPCKINLHLGIGEKRPDGFHTLESLFAALALGDSLCFERTGTEGETVLLMDWEIPGEPVSPEDNLVFKAVSLFREQTQFKSGLRISVTKRIPAGAGLGGGSSDAASSLLALNVLSGAALPPEELMKIAAFLGSDVPFFLSGGVAYVRGRGEIIETVKTPLDFWVILIKPPFSSTTAAAFRLLDQARKSKTRGNTGGTPPGREELLQALSGKIEAWPFYNDFMPLFLNSRLSSPMEGSNLPYAPKARVYRAIFDALRETGAAFSGLSGSGSCCFGIFNSKEEAEKAVKELTQGKSPLFQNGEGSPNQGYFVRLTFFLASRPIPVVQY